MLTDYARQPVELGAALNIDDLTEATSLFVRAIAGRRDLPERLAKMALTFQDRDKLRGDARLLAKAARKLAPNDFRIRVLTEWLTRKEAPLWHFGIIHDRIRNETYARALERFVQPGMTVFEIGTGTGLLAMLAARAGAKHVYTCERRADVAQAARAIIARNGLADRITVIAKDAHVVELGKDIPERADLFVAEIVDNSLLGEAVLPLTELARERFLTKEAILLPRHVAAMGCLASGKGHHEEYRMESALGFDLTPFNCFTPTEIYAHTGGGEAEMLSEPVELIGFDLHQDAPSEESRKLALRATQSGRVEAVMRWLRLDFGDDIVFENRPPQCSSWLPTLHILPEDHNVKPGDEVEVEVFHNHEQLFLIPPSQATE